MIQKHCTNWKKVRCRSFWTERYSYCCFVSITFRRCSLKRRNVGLRYPIIWRKALYSLLITVAVESEHPFRRLSALKKRIFLELGILREGFMGGLCSERCSVYGRLEVALCVSSEWLFLSILRHFWVLLVPVAYGNFPETNIRLGYPSYTRLARSEVNRCPYYVFYIYTMMTASGQGRHSTIPQCRKTLLEGSLAHCRDLVNPEIRFCLLSKMYHHP